jgi:hypothetical protein
MQEENGDIEMSKQCNEENELCKCSIRASAPRDDKN